MELAGACHGRQVQRFCWLCFVLPSIEPGASGKANTFDFVRRHDSGQEEKKSEEESKEANSKAESREEDDQEESQAKD